MRVQLLHYEGDCIDYFAVSSPITPRQGVEIVAEWKSSGLYSFNPMSQNDTSSSSFPSAPSHTTLMPLLSASRSNSTFLD